MAIKTFNGIQYETMGEYFQSRHWKQLRIEYFKQKKHCSCFICHSKDDLKMTHKYLKNNYLVREMEKKPSISNESHSYDSSSSIEIKSQQVSFGVWNGKWVKKYCSVLGRECFKDLRTLCGRCHDLVVEHKLFSILNKNKILNLNQLMEWVRERKNGNDGSVLHGYGIKHTVTILHDKYESNGKRFIFEKGVANGVA